MLLKTIRADASIFVLRQKEGSQSDRKCEPDHQHGRRNDGTVPTPQTCIVALEAFYQDDLLQAGDSVIRQKNIVAAASICMWIPEIATRSHQKAKRLEGA